MNRLENALTRSQEVDQPWEEPEALEATSEAMKGVDNDLRVVSLLEFHCVVEQRKWNGFADKGFKNCVICLKRSGMVQTMVTTRVLLPVTSLFVLLPDDHFAQLLLLFFLNRFLTLFYHVHLLAVLHHFGEVVLGTQVGNAILLQHFPSLHRSLH